MLPEHGPATRFSLSTKFIFISFIFIAFLYYIVFAPSTYNKQYWQTTITNLLGHQQRKCFAGVVTVQSDGRLGNQILEYLSAWSLAKLYNLTAIVPRAMLNVLQEGFVNLSVQNIESYIDQHYDICGVFLTEEHVHKSATSELFPLPETVQTSWDDGRPIVLPKWVVLVETIAPLWREVKTELRFKPEYSQNAQNLLTQFKNSGTNMTDEYQTVFVGVHVRRTDYTTFLKKRYSAEEMVTPTYFRHAVSWLRHALGPANIIFVLASDDITWCIAHLIPELLKEKNHETHLGTFSVFPASQGDSQSAFYDLALLSACNHTILSYGTYGISAALLSGGTTVVFDIQASERNKNITEKIHTMMFIGHLANWVAVH